MLNVLIYASVGVFLLLPYYLCVFLLEKGKNKKHIFVSLLFNVIMAFVYYLQTKTLYSPASIILAVITVYYAFTYVFQVRKIENTISKEIIRTIVGSKYIWIVLHVLIGICLVVMLGNIILLMNTPKCILLDKIYFVGIMLVSFLQMLGYYKDYRILRA